jgi:hypothetical protein
MGQREKDRSVGEVGAANDILDAIEDYGARCMEKDFILVCEQLP